MSDIVWTENSIGRKVPLSAGGRSLKPYAGLFGCPLPERGVGTAFHSCSERGRPNKLVHSWDELFDRLDLRDGMTVSFHHHLRDGDAVVNEVVDRLAARGLKGLVIAPSALFPVHDHLIPYIESGVIDHIEGSMNGLTGEACSRGKMKGLSILRSHGGRCRAIETGELQIDLAIIAAPCADPFGNANGFYGKSACGPLAYAVPDSLYARQVVVVTDGLVPYPCSPNSIRGGSVDYVLQVDSIGDPQKIVSGTTCLTHSPTQLLIADLASRFVEETGIMKEGFSFQAGAGGISLAAVAAVAERMRRRGIKASYAHGGATGILVKLLEEGLLGAIIDIQSFDLEAVRSGRENPRHIESTPFDSYGPQGAGCSANMLDFSLLGATEIDLDFNVNVNTHSDGMLRHGIGGHQDVAVSSSCCIVTAPLFRKRIPIVREKVTTVSCPGEAVDVLITERGIAINPRRPDLRERAEKAGLPVKEMSELMEMARAITGVPDQPQFGDRPVALVQWRDGSILDVVREIEAE